VRNARSSAENASSRRVPSDSTPTVSAAAFQGYVRQRLNIEARPRLHIEILARKNHRLAAVEDFCRAGFLVGGRLVTFFDMSGVIGEIEGVNYAASHPRGRAR